VSKLNILIYLFLTISFIVGVLLTVTLKSTLDYIERKDQYFEQELDERIREVIRMERY